MLHTRLVQRLGVIRPDHRLTPQSLQLPHQHDLLLRYRDVVWSEIIDEDGFVVNESESRNLCIKGVLLLSVHILNPEHTTQEDTYHIVILVPDEDHIVVLILDDDRVVFPTSHDDGDGPSTLCDVESVLESSHVVH